MMNFLLLLELPLIRGGGTNIRLGHGPDQLGHFITLCRDLGRISKHLEQLLIRIFQFFKIGAPRLVNLQKHLEQLLQVLHP